MVSCYARLFKFFAYVVFGSGIVCVLFPFCSVERRQSVQQWWCQRLCAVLCVHIEADKQQYVQGAAGIVVANHISWLDILVLNSLMPMRFVAKIEIKKWWLLGYLTARVGTIFINRQRMRGMKGVIQEVWQTVQNGEMVCIFPEGTTTDGMRLLPFKANLLEVGLHTTIYPIILRYEHAGKATFAPTYSGSVSLWQSFMRVLKTPNIRARVFHLPPVLHAHQHRRQLAHELNLLFQQAWRQIF